MKKIILAIALMACFAPVSAQQDDEEYELRGNEKFGYIIDKDGKKIEGIVRLQGTETTPWVNQKKVKFIDKASVDAEKKRQKFKVLDTDDLQEYVAIDGEQERHFRLIKYANAREGVMNQSGSGIGGKLKTIKNLSTTRHMAEVLVDGKLKLYRLYGYPAGFAAGKDDVARAEADERNIIDNPSILVQKEEDKVRTFEADDIKKLVDDCKTVSEKLSAGQYASYDPAKQEKKRSGMGKLIKNEVDRVGTQLANMGKEVFTDYNKTCM